MCGICGIINFNNVAVDEKPVRKMMQIQKHRGPDDEGIFIEDNVGLGFVRLSIIDLSSAGHQPKLSHDERYVIVFNGEIYNYLELREELEKEGVNFTSHSDTEVLLNAYIHWGEVCLNRFNGMWAFAIYDREKKTIFIARDRFGIKPLYYIVNEKYFAFSSEIPPLLSLTNKKPTPDYQTIFDFLVFNRTDQTENTFFKEVKKIKHGQKLTLITNNKHFLNTKLEIKKWYDLKEEVSKSKGFKDENEYREMFSSAIGLSLRSDVSVGVCLSGGLDSSSIVSMLLEDYDKKDLSTFSAVYSKGQFGDESEFIDEYKHLLKNMYFTSPDARSLKTDLATFVKAHGEPIPTTSPYAQFKVMELAQGTVVVLLDGQGADEELAGYHYFFGFYFLELLNQFKIGKLICEMYYYLSKHRNLMGFKSFLYIMLPKRLRTTSRIREKGYLVPNFVNQFKKSSSIADNIYGSKSLTHALLDHFEFKLEHLLKWEDCNSMWFSLESRVPFLDYRLVQKTLATSNNQKIRNGMTKHILREAMREILPEKIRVRRDKIGFSTPQDEWFREPAWQTIVNEILISESFKGRNLVDPNKAQDLYNKYISGKINIAKEVWKWVHLELWFREFID